MKNESGIKKGQPRQRLSSIVCIKSGLSSGEEKPGKISPVAHGCGLDVADRRCVANTPGNPVHIQFALPALRTYSKQSTTIGSAHRAAGRLHGFGGVFISEPDACSIRFLLRIIRSAVRLLQSTRSRAGSVDGL
jgi:hypothetical protein